MLCEPHQVQDDSGGLSRVLQNDFQSPATLGVVGYGQLHLDTPGDYSQGVVKLMGGAGSHLGNH